MTVELGSIGQDEIVSRYVMSSRHIRNDGTVKGQLFHDTRNPAEISVVRISSLTNDQIWAIATEYMPKSVHGRADIVVSEAENKQLLESIEHDTNASGLYIKVVAAPDPHPYHANITYNPPKMAHMKHIAKHLARHSKLVRAS